MGIEFDPLTSTYWTTAYTGTLVNRGQPTELAPSLGEQTVPVDETTSIQVESRPPQEVLSDQAEETPAPQRPYWLTVGSLVDTVV